MAMKRSRDMNASVGGARRNIVTNVGGVYNTESLKEKQVRDGVSFSCYEFMIFSL